MFMDEVVPEIQGIGSVGASNITQYSGYSVAPVNSFVQSFTWLGGVLYSLAIILVFAFAFAARATANKWLIGIFLAFTLLLILCSIFISNIYEDFYNDTGDLGVRLQEQALLSFLILHSPIIFTIVIFIAGIIMFSGMQQEEFI